MHHILLHLVYFVGTGNEILDQAQHAQEDNSSLHDISGNILFRISYVYSIMHCRNEF